MFTLFLSLLPAVVQNDDAEKRFKTMEEKIAAAKSLQLTFETTVEGLKEGGKLKGTLTLGQDNKMHLDGSLQMTGKGTNWLIVSDGTRMREIGLDIISEATPKKLTENFRSSLKQGGFVMGIFMSSLDGKGETLWPVFRASDFALGKKETIGKREAQIILRKLTPSDAKKNDIAFAETVWIDVETNLPLKRIFAGTVENMKFTFTETYNMFTLDPKIDPKLFVIPK
jgi:outer membrane lipoprotein-sorting protein